MKTMNITELEFTLSTYAPFEQLPENLALEIKSQARKFVNKNVLFDVADDLKCDLSNTEFHKIVINRITNLALNKIVNCERVNAEVIHELFSCNLSLSREEERAIIDACRAGVKEASLYIRVFYAVRVIGYMKQHHLAHSKNAKDIFAEFIDVAMSEIISNFDETKMVTGGLTVDYFYYQMRDYQRNKMLTNAEFVKISPRAARDFSLIRAIESKESIDYDEYIRRREYRKTHNSDIEIGKEFGVTGKSIRCYRECGMSLSLDEPLSSSDNTVSSRGDFVFGTSDGLDNVYINVVIDDFFNEVAENFSIEKEECQHILSAIDEYKLTHTKRVKISERELREIARDLNMHYCTIKSILDLFGETFKDLF